MSNQPEPTKPWKPNDFAFYGAMLGFGLGIVHAYVHAFWSQTSDGRPVEHILWKTVLFVVAGAALSAVLAVVRNQLNGVGRFRHLE